MGDLADWCEDQAISALANWHSEAIRLSETCSNELLIEKTGNVIQYGCFNETFLPLIRSICSFHEKHGRMSEKQRWSLCLFIAEYTYD